VVVVVWYRVKLECWSMSVGRLVLDQSVDRQVSSVVLMCIREAW
jgi:hypothetical protein